MPRRVRNPLFVALALILALTASYRLIALRLGSGDSYPPYSTMRYDPLGSALLFDALSRIDGIEVARNFVPPTQMIGGSDSTIIFLGSWGRWGWQPNSDAMHLQYARDGARVIIGFRHEEPSDTPVFHRLHSDTPSQDTRPYYRSILEVGTVYATKNERRTSWAIPADPYRNADSIPCYTALTFESFTADWTVLYRRDGKPVVLERRYGKGSVVLCAPAFLFTNESLNKQPHAEFLATLIGPTRQVIFDEYHFGVTHTENIAMIALRHGLGFPALGLVALALLFIWRNATSLVPRITGHTADYTAAGFDTAEGIVSLLRKNIAIGGLPAAIDAEWKTAAPRHRKVEIDRYDWQKIRLAKSADDIVKNYNQAGGTPAERKAHPWKKKD